MTSSRFSLSDLSFSFSGEVTPDYEEKLAVISRLREHFVIPEERIRSNHLGRTVVKGGLSVRAYTFDDLSKELSALELFDEKDTSPEVLRRLTYSEKPLVDIHRTIMSTHEMFRVRITNDSPFMGILGMALRGLRAGDINANDKYRLNYDYVLSWTGME